MFDHLGEKDQVELAFPGEFVALDVIDRKMEVMGPPQGRAEVSVREIDAEDLAPKGPFWQTGPGCRSRRCSGGNCSDEGFTEDRK